MLELYQEIRAGVPLERDQLGIVELGILADLRARDEAQRAVAGAVRGALGG